MEKYLVSILLLTHFITQVTSEERAKLFARCKTESHLEDEQGVEQHFVMNGYVPHELDNHEKCFLVCIYKPDFARDAKDKLNVEAIFDKMSYLFDVAENRDYNTTELRKKCRDDLQKCRDYEAQGTCQEEYVQIQCIWAVTESVMKIIEDE